MIVIKNFGTFKTREELYGFLSSLSKPSIKIDCCFMRILNLSRSGIASLDIEFMPNLRKLIADENPLSVLKIKAKKLKLLQINQTFIKELKLLTPSLEVLNAWGGIWTESLNLELSNLRRLDVSKSWRLKRLNLKAPKIEVIRVKGTHISNLEGDFPNLLKADARDTLINRQSSIMFNVRFLNLSRTVFQRFIGDYPNLEKLTLHNSKVVEISGSFPSLRTLKCSITYSLKTIVGEFPVLEVLEATHGRLWSIPRNLPKLRTAYLTCNSFERLEGDYPELTCLYVNECSSLTSLKIYSLRTVRIIYPYCPRLKYIAVFGPMGILESFNDRSVVAVTGNCLTVSGRAGRREIDLFYHDSGTSEAIKDLPLPIYEEIVEHIVEVDDFVEF